MPSLNQQLGRKGAIAHSLLAARCSLLAARCSLLAAGCWLLAAGCWLLAAGCWLLAAGEDHYFSVDNSGIGISEEAPSSVLRLNIDPIAPVTLVAAPLTAALAFPAATAARGLSGLPSPSMSTARICLLS
ncbi:hypothetical protein [Cryobacterium sp. TMT3-29-2]|uniref:hypothetical protein n=1 Tax=Cryobacterium sp. TMT3-29-2 TaxID=2555867 RepID=UPI0010747D8C|nr:hypothetical protein [Cryobacterium sp. TMT3-29-2]TFC83035.1 hypothetical protein E3O67_15415 [Cryobacterium sp. TMT3-29-2]